MSVAPPDGCELNELVASQFEEGAELLDAQGGDPFRIRALTRGADTVRRLPTPLDEIYAAGGLAGLVDLPGIGYALARGIIDVIELRSWRWLDRLRGDVDPEAVFCTVAGIGPGLARRIHDELGIDHLEDLEAAAHDGRLAKVAGFGPRRVRAVRECLGSRLAGRGPDRHHDVIEPPVEDLLDIDREYRRKDELDQLPRIAPLRFNPGHVRWLPILHTERGGQRFTAMFSNTARAHQLGHNRDWVIIYRDGHGDGQWTVVTETHGPRRGERVVRGREGAGARVGFAAAVKERGRGNVEEMTFGRCEPDPMREESMVR